MQQTERQWGKGGDMVELDEWTRQSVSHQQSDTSLTRSTDPSVPIER